MPRKFLKRYMPDHEALKRQWYLRPFQALLHDPALLYPNRRTASRALAIGLFFGFIPFPFQMASAALLALWWRVNLPIAVGGVWVTNPVTMGPIFYGEYKLGAWLLGIPAGDWSFELSWRWLTEEAVRIWKPMLLGTGICSVFFAIAGYYILNSLWMLSVTRRYRERPGFKRFPNPFRHREKK